MPSQLRRRTQPPVLPLPGPDLTQFYPNWAMHFPPQSTHVQRFVRSCIRLEAGAILRRIPHYRHDVRVVRYLVPDPTQRCIMVTVQLMDTWEQIVLINYHSRPDMARTIRF